MRNRTQITGSKNSWSSVMTQSGAINGDGKVVSTETSRDQCGARYDVGRISVPMMVMAWVAGHTRRTKG